MDERGARTVSVDEKTGIQALEHCAPALGPLPGCPERIEYEYKRRGTLSLIASLDVATGKILPAHLGPTRTENDFAKHVGAVVATDPKAEWVFISDQLNTHQSESLVRLAAKLGNIRTDLGKKGKAGILKSLESRAQFLSNPAHRVRFIYTPKHSSWLNQIELWFGILARKLLKRASFPSIAALRQRILAFIRYFNETMAKPFRWTYTGCPLRV